MSRIILITGAGTGIGAETARHLAEGNVVFVHYHSSEGAAARVASDVGKKGGTASLVKADLATERGCAALVEEVARRTDRLDALVNNAGGLVRRLPVTQLEWSLMEEVFALNTFSTMKVTSLCVPLLMKGTDPCVINITSVAARIGAPSATIYGAAKGAIDTFTRGAARELAPRIRVNAVAPGVILTPFHDKVSTPERMKEWKEATPLKRNGEAVHIARAIRFILENDFVNGETVDVNGGLSMR
jgi:3-oxoacyl-[acyl-carrier protein] reductase